MQTLGLVDSLGNSLRAPAAKSAERVERKAITSHDVLNEAYHYDRPSSFSRGLRINMGAVDLPLISGTASIDDEGVSVYVGDFRAQLWRTYRNITRLLESEGADWHDIVRTSCYLRDIERDYKDFNEFALSSSTGSASIRSPRAPESRRGFAGKSFWLRSKRSQCCLTLRSRRVCLRRSLLRKPEKGRLSARGCTVPWWSGASGRRRDFGLTRTLPARNPFGEACPQVPLGAICNWECIFDELGIEQDWHRFLFDDPKWALDVSRQYNDRSEEVVGRRLLPETTPDPSRQWPPVKMLHDVFEAKNVWEGGKNGSWWLLQSADSPQELSKLLDRVEKRLDNLRAFMLPDNWQEEKARLMALGCKPPLYRGQRGPCTFATSVYGPENLMLLWYDDRDLFTRFSDLIGRAILGIARVLDEEAGYTPATAPRGWGWADDNSCLFNTRAYEAFAMPIHRAVFGTYAQEPKDSRYQHSDSNMAHLLPQLGSLNLTGTNFGPTLRVGQIRSHLPNAVIDGQLAPFTFSRNDEPNMIAEFLRDFDEARETRGLVFATAGSINNGSRLSGMRLLMAAIQRYGRYE